MQACCWGTGGERGELGERGVGGVDVGRGVPEDRACQACALFRSLQSKHAEAGSTLTFLGSRWGAEEPAGHRPCSPVPGTWDLPPVVCGPGKGAQGLCSDGASWWFGWGFLLTEESSGFPWGMLCVCTSSVPWPPPGLFPALCMGVCGRDNGICLFLCSLQQGLDLAVMLEESSWSAGGAILCAVGCW